MLLILAVAFIVVSIGLLGLVVLLRNRNKIEDKLFSLLCFVAALWVIANFIGANYKTYDITAFFVHADFFIGSWVALSFLLFITAFANTTTIPDKVIKKLTYVSIAITAVISTLTLTETFIYIEYPKAGLPAGIHYNAMFVIYVASLLFMMGSGIYVLTNAYLNSKGDEKRKQFRDVLAGFIVAVVFVGFANLILPSLSKSAAINLLVGNMAYVGILYFVLTVYIAIIKNHLFDIKYVVFRLLAYTVSLSLITILFVFLAFTLTSIFFGGHLVSFSLQIYYVLTAIIVALLYGPIRRFINAGTDRLFFQQTYSINTSLGKISTFLTRSTDSHNIQAYILEVLNETVRPEYALFLMYENQEKLRTGLHTGNIDIKRIASTDLLDDIVHLKQKITLSEDISKNKSYLKEHFRSSGIELVLRLHTSNKSIGYIILSNKKNGNNYSHRDVQFLTLAVNDIALALQNAMAFEEIRVFNATLQAKVSSATAALKRTNQKLVALDDTKDEFISMASHQLRTPLTSIKGYISMMLEGDLGKINDTQRKALEEAFNSSQRMVFLISDFLNISRIRTGKFVMEKSDTDLNKIVLEEIAQLRDLAGLRDQTINYKPPKNFPVVQLDETKTRQVMMNFIDNAIFYTPKNGKIDIVLEQTDKEIIFSVTDTGIGVPKNVQHRLFTKFFRAENARNARPDGTGLGLFMGQKIIDTQGGKIIFSSVEHQGSTFGFRFPLKIVSATGAKSKQ